MNAPNNAPPSPPDDHSVTTPDDAARGWEVARDACERARVAFGDRLVSVYAIGSLAHGGFAAAVSDVDIAVLVDQCDDSVPALVRGVVESTRDALGGDLADRLSVFYGDWRSFSSPPPTARLGAIDRLDLMDSGVLMWGIDHRARDGSRPSPDELIAETAGFVRDWLTRRRPVQELIAAGPRVLTKNVLFPVRFLYTHATGRAGGNADAVAWYRDRDGPHLELAEQALRWRSGDVDPVAARRLLERHLDALYAECCEVYGV